MPEILFTDRMDAGQQLAGRLAGLKPAHPVILALPRGGVPVAHVVAQELGADLDLLMVRKIGVPWHPELALAAVVDGDHPETVVNEEVAALIPVPRDYLRREAERQLREIEARRSRYLGDRKPLAVQGRVVVVVDDGIATGASIRAALKALRRQQPARLIVAIPVAPADTLEQLKSDADEVVCLATPDPFIAVGMHYGDFAQTSDDEVVDILARHQGAGNASRPGSGEEAVIAEVRRRLLADQRIDLAHQPVAMSFADGLLVIEGEVDSLAAKRLAVATARRVPAVRDVADRLRLRPSRALPDPALKAAVRTALLAEPQLHRHSLFVVDQGRRLAVREVAAPAGEIEVAAVEGGVVTLRGRVEDILARQLAGVVVWRTQGVRDVVNELEAIDAGARERELDQAVRLALNADAELKGAGVTARVHDGVVTLEGRVDSDDDCLRAESAAWMVDGVREVVNHVAVRH